MAPTRSRVAAQFTGILDWRADTGPVPPPTAVPPRAARHETVPRPDGAPGAPVPHLPRDVRRAVTLLLITTVAPGLAQMLLGDRRIGRWALRLWALLVACPVLLGAVWLVDRTVVLRLITWPLLLGAVAVLLMAGAVIWPALLVDAWRLGNVHQLPTRARRWVAVLLAVLVVLTAGTTLAAGRRLWAARDLIANVFGSGTSVQVVDGRYNVLLLGGDAGKNRIGLRPDSITLASIDADKGGTVLFSLPRNLQNVRFPAGTPAARALPHGWSCGDACLLNALYTWGSQHADLFPGARDPGAAAMMQAVQGVTGLPVSSYVLIDLQGFRSLIDAMGGIELTSVTRVPIGGETSPISGYIEPGRQHLDGYHALWYARSRTGSSDYARMARQRCVMSAMLNQLDPATALKHFQGIAAASQKVVGTDIPAGDLATFIELAAKAKQQKITSVQFVPPLIHPARPDFAAIRSQVKAALRGAKLQGESSTSRSSSGSSPTPASSASSASSSTSESSTSQSSSVAGAADVRSVCTP